MWYWELKSREYGEEEFGGYDTEEDAHKGIERVKAQAKRLNDGIARTYSEPYYRE